MSDDGSWIVWTCSHSGGLIDFEESISEEGAYHDAFMAVDDRGRKIMCIERPDGTVVDQGRVEAYLDQRMPWRHDPPPPAVARLVIKPPVGDDLYDTVIYDEEFVEGDYRSAVSQFGAERVTLERLTQPGV